MKIELQTMDKNNPIAGIYKLNFPNGKCYIGQSQNIRNRIMEHNQRAALNKHGNREVQLCEYAINKYGQINEFEILENISDLSLLDERETYWIKYYRSFNREYGYNLTTGGDVSGKRGVDNSNASFTQEQLVEIIEKIKLGKQSFTELAFEYNVDKETISRINSGKTYFNPNLSYPLRDSSDKGFMKKTIYDYLSEEEVLNLKEDLLYRWDLQVETDLPKKYNISLDILRDINHGILGKEIGDYQYPIRGKNVRNKNNLTQQDILDILDLLKNTTLTMTDIGNRYNFGRAAISDINKGLTYKIKDYQYPARKTK